MPAVSRLAGDGSSRSWEDQRPVNAMASKQRHPARVRPRRVSVAAALWVASAFLVLIGAAWVMGNPPAACCLLSGLAAAGLLGSRAATPAAS
jgi:hypothetical protein